MKRRELLNVEADKKNHLKTSLQTYRTEINFDIRKLKISASHQRKLNKANIEHIKNNYVRALVKILVEERKDGTLQIVGGQHCWRAAIQLKDYFHDVRIVPLSDVYPDLEEKILVLGDNDGIRFTASQETAGGLIVEDPELIRHREVLRKGGREHGKRSGDNGWRCFPTFGYTLSLEKEVGEDELVRQLKFANVCWEGQKSVGKQEIMMAINIMFSRYATDEGAFPEERLKIAFKNTQIQYLEEEALENGVTQCGKAGRSKAIAGFLVQKYNEAQKNGKNRLHFVGARYKIAA
jgi:hypothetical protein